MERFLKLVVISALFKELIIAGEIKPSLRNILNNAPSDTFIAVIVHLKEQADLSGFARKDYAGKVEYLKQFARQFQANILSYLSKFKDSYRNLKSYWIFNGFYMEAKPAVIESVAKKPEINYVVESFVIPLETSSSQNIEIIESTEWNVEKVGAHYAWDLGITGEGVIIGYIDSGFDPNHPALQGKWLSPYWYDAVDGANYPHDDCGHGTKTIGIILGGDGYGPFPDDIGVAPGAKFVAVRCFSSTGGEVPDIHEGFQKIAEWKGQGVNIVAVNNSWSYGLEDLEFWNDCVNLKNLGIICVFAIGNFSSAPGSCKSPGNYPIVIGVGATNSNDDLWSSSRRGPAPDKWPWNDPQYWPRSDWNRIKPDISAPGVNVRSSSLDGGYEEVTGTSFAAPHVTGAIALLYQVNPDLSF